MFPFIDYFVFYLERTITSFFCIRFSRGLLFCFSNAAADMSHDNWSFFFFMALGPLNLDCFSSHFCALLWDLFLSFPFSCFRFIFSFSGPQRFFLFSFLDLILFLNYISIGFLRKGTYKVIFESLDIWNVFILPAS